MKYCKKCLYASNHALNITFNDEGICSGCQIHEEKFTLDWEVKERKLHTLLESYRSQDGLNYDCIIPVSGARDSYYIVDLIKNKYNMNPLLVSYNKHYNTHVGNRNLAYLKTYFNCDHVGMVVQPQKVKKITRYTLETMGSIYWHILAGESVFPVQIAVKFKIPLIIWGVHQGVDQVGMYSHNDYVEMSRKHRKEHDLMGYEAEDLLGEDSPLSYNDLVQYFYPDDKEIEKVGVRGIYLSNFIPWDSKSFHEEMIKKYNYESLPQQRTFDTYNDIDSLHYNGVHDLIKQMKCGYSKVIDHASREIRWKRLSRDEAIEYVHHYQKIVPQDLAPLLEFLELDESTFFSFLEKFKTKEISSFRSEKSSTINPNFFQITPSKAPNDDTKYSLLEKGYVN